ncbi:MAG: sigma-70 family RNA polymerase sigma factor [Caldilineaceae bacterium]|nr:sigma-70 family RNA polymerase sigma factor [Caldilineaceae bacterium]
MLAIAQRDEHAFLQLYQQYCNLVFSLALRVVRHQVLAEEVTQDVFLKIWHQPDRWNPAVGQFSSWLLTITRNAAIDRLRKEQRHPIPNAGIQEPLFSEATEVSISDNPLWFEGQVLAHLLQELPEEQRLLIELAFYQGYTHSELAEGLQLPLGTVKTRLRSGLQKLRAAWEEHHRQI